MDTVLRQRWRNTFHNTTEDSIGISTRSDGASGDLHVAATAELVTLFGAFSCRFWWRPQTQTVHVSVYLLWAQAGWRAGDLSQSLAFRGWLRLICKAINELTREDLLDGAINFICYRWGEMRGWWMDG